MTTRTLVSGIYQRTVSISLPKFPAVSLRPIMFLGGFISAVFFAVCVFQAIFLVNETYSLGNYEKRLNEVARENMFLENKFVQDNSLVKIEALAKKLNFVPAGKIHYIKVLTNTVVKK